MRTAAAALSLCLATAALAQTAEPTPRVAVECAPRDGLPNVVAKAKAGGPVRVAYLGGSITASNGWRVWSRQYLQSQYPGARVEEIRAAIPGTGAEFGAARLQRDVLDHKPDLIFVEFAVNGAGATRDRGIESMEGIVRQARAANPYVDVCFVYTLYTPTLPDYQAGRVPALVERMEEVADHYGLPTINFGVDVAARVAAGTLVFEDESGTDGDGARKTPTTRAADGKAIFSADGVHPLASTGHLLYYEAFVRSWPQIVAASKPRAMPAPLIETNWSRVRLVAPDALERVGTWSVVDPNDAAATTSRDFNDDRPLWRSEKVGDALTFTFTGTAFGLHAVKGPDVAQARITVDDRPPVVAKLFDGTCVEGRYRTKPWFYPEPLTPGTHRVRIEAIAEPDKAKRIAASGKAIEDAGVFERQRLYLRGIYLVNER